MSETQEHKPKLPFGVWLATEGGRKCPQCGKYAKPDHLGSLGGSWYDDAGKWAGHVSIYGHLPGYGCNREQENDAPKGGGSGGDG